jgi:hypothetical protein
MPTSPTRTETPGLCSKSPAKELALGLRPKTDTLMLEPRCNTGPLACIDYRHTTCV